MTTPSDSTKPTAPTTPTKATSADASKDSTTEADDTPKLQLHYQAAGQARQVRNELANLEAYGAGDGERAKALRRTLEGMGVDPDAAVNATGDAPAGRSAKTEQMVRTDAPVPSSGASVASTSSSSSGTTASVKPPASK